MDTKTFPGADCYSDHIPVVADIALRLKKVNKRKREERRQLKLLLTDEQLKESYRVEVTNRYEVLNSEEPLEREEEADRDWRNLKTAFTEPVNEMVPNRKEEEGRNG